MKAKTLIIIGLAYGAKKLFFDQKEETASNTPVIPDGKTNDQRTDEQIFIDYSKRLQYIIPKYIELLQGREADPEYIELLNTVKQQIETDLNPPETA